MKVSKSLSTVNSSQLWRNSWWTWFKITRSKQTFPWKDISFIMCIHKSFDLNFQKLPSTHQCIPKLRWNSQKNHKFKHTPDPAWRVHFPRPLQMNQQSPSSDKCAPPLVLEISGNAWMYLKCNIRKKMNSRKEGHGTIWLKSDLYLRYRIEDLINPHYWSCSVLIILTNQLLLLCYWSLI